MIVSSNSHEDVLDILENGLIVLRTFSADKYHASTVSDGFDAVVLNLPSLPASPLGKHIDDADEVTFVDDVRSDISTANATIDYYTASKHQSPRNQEVDLTRNSTAPKPVEMGDKKDTQLPRHVLKNTLPRNEVLRGCQGFLFDSSSSALRLVANVEPLADNFILGCFLSGIIDVLNYLGNFYIFQRFFHRNEEVVVSMERMIGPLESLKEFLCFDLMTAGFVCGTLRFYQSLWLASGSVQMTGVVVKICLYFLWSYLGRMCR
jgi:hypothetical protein